ncbi:Anaphase-promoting complex subunit 5 [Phytophthora nicotianae]|uniref:Palmitoyltransferase n=1 Tax=Phytophthora nicotianae TaxID=4792 RepID=A0A0W8DGW4_PHYNI|nr:Anaphase-promoting complex subunit 5 [Phytophthora nicotianae]
MARALPKSNGELSAPSAFDCAKLGLLPELQELVQQDFDVNAYDETSNATLLHHAAISGKMGVMEAKVNVDALGGEMNTTPLFWAASHNQIYAVELLLRHGADPNFRDELGFTPFLVAIQRCFPITAAYLVAKGSDINQRMQVMNNIPMAVRMLLDVRAETTIVNKEGLTALGIARVRLRPDSTVRHLLTEDEQLQNLARITSIPRGSYGDKRKAASLMFGVNVASIVYLVGSFPRFCGYCSTTFCAITAVSCTMIGVTLFKTATSDPGEVFTSYDEKLHNIRYLVESKLPSATKLCLTCLHKRPLRGKHCAETNSCIAKFDHYCPFVVNAIGVRNHAAFLGFLFSAVLSISLELIACWRFARAQPKLVADFTVHWQYWKWNTSLWAFLSGENVAAVGTPGLFDWIWSVAHFQPFLFCVMLLDVVQIAWIAYMLFFHVYLMCAALTTNEVVKNENLDRAYSRGVVNNIVDFLGLPGQRPVDWRRIYNLEEFKNQIALSSGPMRKDL